MFDVVMAINVVKHVEDFGHQQLAMKSGSQQTGPDPGVYELKWTDLGADRTQLCCPASVLPRIPVG